MTRTRSDTHTEDDLAVHGYLSYGLPAWTVTGPRGSVTYLMGGSMITFEPTWSHAEVVVDRRAGEIQAYAILSDDDQVLKLLTEHYRQLPAGPPDWPATPAAWRALHSDDLVAAMLRCRWFAHPDTPSGTWYVMPVDRPPVAGVPTVGAFLGEDIARAVAHDHNAHLPEHTIGDKR